MSAAIDFGTHCLRSLAHPETRLLSRSVRSAYAVLPDTSEQRAMLAKLELPYAICDSDLAVIGDAAEQVPTLSAIPLTPLISDGEIAADDPPARQMLNVLVESLLPPPGADEICAVITPGNLRQQAGTRRFLQNLVALRGYECLETSPGRALVLATAADQRFSAIGISLGAGTCDLSLVINGVETARRICPRGGNWIDRELAIAGQSFVWDRDGCCYLDTDTVRQWKEAPSRSLSTAGDEAEERLCNLTADLLGAVARDVGKLMETVDSGIDARTIPVICAGGLTGIRGFVNEFRSALTGCGLSIPDLRLIDDPFAIARGGMIQAELRSEVLRSAA